MYPYHVFDLEPAGTFGMYPICYWWVSGGYIQPEPAMYSRCFCWFPGPLTPSVFACRAAWTVLAFERESDAGWWPELHGVAESELDLDGKAAK